MAKWNEYDLNDTVTFRAAFKVGTVLTDPTTVSLAVTDPAGSTTTYTYAGATVTKDSTGNYSKALSLTQAGEWVYTWTGTGTVPAVGVSRVSVRRAGA